MGVQLPTHGTVTHTVTTGEELLSVEHPPHRTSATPQTYALDVARGARVRSSEQGDPLFRIDLPRGRGRSTAEVRVFVHREMVAMTARDYGAQFARDLAEDFPGIVFEAGAYSTFVDRPSPLVVGLCGRRTIVGLRSARAANRITGIATMREGDDVSREAAMAVLQSLRLA